MICGLSMGQCGCLLYALLKPVSLHPYHVVNCGLRFFSQLSASMQMSDWSVQWLTQVVWRFALLRSGALSVITCGQMTMQTLYADSWDSPGTVRWCLISRSYFLFYIQFHNLYDHTILFADATAQSGAAFGPGTGPISLNSVGCIGNETRLADCPWTSVTTGCTHSNDASATCVTECK